MPALLLLLALSSPALAAGYTVDDIVAGAAQGLPEETLLGMAASPAGPVALDAEAVTRLLRSRVPPSVIAALTGGAHPTPAALEAAKLPGPTWADAPIPQPPAPLPEGATAAPTPEEAAPPASEYQRYITERVPAPERTITNRHGERWRSANQLVAAGVGESIVGLAVLGALASRADGGVPGVRAAGAGLVAVGTGSVLVGSLMGRDALHDDGYRVTPAVGWTGVGFWGLGATVYGFDLAFVEGEPRPLASGASLVATGTALGLVQVAVNAGERKRQLSAGMTRGWVVTPLADARTPGLMVEGVF